jgi:hypothetical protein
MAKNGFVLRNGVKGAILGGSETALSRPSAFICYWQKVKSSFSFGGKRALCFKKVCVLKFSHKGTFFHKSMMMMIFFNHIYNCLAYMARLAKKYF